MPRFTSQQKKIISVFIFCILFIVLLATFRKKIPKPVSLEFWGLYDEPEIWNQISNQFHKLYPHISIRYTKKDPSTYEDELLKAFAENNAPDIFLVLSEWLPRYQTKIYPLDLKNEKELTLKYLKEYYPDVVIQNLIQDNKLVGVPLGVDTLALYYNKDIFNHFNIALPPTTWEEVLELVPILRQVDLNGNLMRGAISLGTAENIEWFSDILSALMLQKGSSIVNYSNLLFNFNLGNEGKEAIQFYTQFADPKNKNYTWNEYKPNSLLAFSQGSLAMMIGYERAYNYLKEKNPQLNFEVSPLPQFKQISLKINYASIPTLVINNRTNNYKQQAAWLFLKFITQSKVSEDYFLLTGHPPARRDLITKYLNDPNKGVFISQILSSRSYYQFDSEKVKDVFGKMINKINRKQLSVKDAVDEAVQQLNFLWAQSLKKN